MDNIDFLLLMSGKVCYDEVDRIKRVVRKECLRYPSFMHKMTSYMRTLQKICSVNGLYQQHSVQKPPAAYLKRLVERKSGKDDDDVNVKASENKNRKVVQSRQGKVNRRKQKSCDQNNNDIDDDDKSDIERFPVSGNLGNIVQYKMEEAKQRQESCRIYATFESVTKELATLDVSIDQKIQQLRNIVKEHSWSNSEAAYKERLLNQASCELMSDSSMIIEHNVSTLNETDSNEMCLSVLQPTNSPTKVEQTKDTSNRFKSAMLKSEKWFHNLNFNSNSCRSRYVKRQQISLPLITKKDENSCPSTIKRKRKTEELTDSAINEKVKDLKKKFLSDVNPHEIIFLDMSDDEDQNSSSSVLVDINNDITTKQPVHTLENATSGKTDIFKPQPDENSNKLIPAGTRQKPNFILRNKLLAKRPSVTPEKIIKPGNLAQKKESRETDSDSDDSSRRQKKVKKNNYTHVVSQYSQFKPVIVQKPKLDREFLTADLCKPFFIQAERLLQAEKVLRKTRYHRHAVKNPAIAMLKKRHHSLL